MSSRQKKGQDFSQDYIRHFEKQLRGHGLK
jgi:hypothetical protein